MKKRGAKERPPPPEISETRVRQIVKLLSPEADVGYRRYLAGCVRGGYKQAREELSKPPLQGNRAANKEDGVRLSELLAQVEKILRRVPNEAFAVTDPSPHWEDTIEGRRATAWLGLNFLEAVAQDLRTAGIGDHGLRDRYGPVSATAAYKLMINVSDLRPTSGGPNSKFRKITRLYCAALKGLSDDDDELQISSLERACEGVLATVKKRGDPAFHWEAGPTKLVQRPTQK
jgi:hypothetical protein